MSWFTDAFGRWYGIVYPHRDTSEAERLIATLDRLAPLAGRRLLDVGCGEGRHLRAFETAGARPVGVDLSPELLDGARRLRLAERGGWELVRGDMRRLPFAAACFDLVTSLFTSFGYFGEDGDSQVLADAARVLVPGGLHVLDFLNRERVLAHPTPGTSRVSGDFRVDEERRIEDGRLVVKEVEIRPAGGGDPLARYEERVMLYGETELRERLESAGLRPRTTLGEYDGRPFDAAESTRLVILSEKAGA